MGIQYLPVTSLCGLKFSRFGSQANKCLKDGVPHLESQRIFDAHGIGQSGLLEAILLTS